MAVERNDALRIGNKVAVERYQWATRWAEGHVVDAGCGCGYGCELLRRAQAVSHDNYTGRQILSVVGVDVSQEAIRYAQEHYPGPYIVANCETQSFKGFDTVVCLEALSHFLDPFAWLKQLDVPRVIISAPMTPSKAVYPWRKWDIPPVDFRELFTPRWKIRDVLKQKTSGAEYQTIWASA